MRLRSAAIPLLLAVLLPRSARDAPAELRVYELQRSLSSLHVVTHRSGIFSFLGHEHAIIPLEWSADLCLADPVPAGAHGSLLIRTGSLVIDSDSGRALAGLGRGPGAGTRREIQDKMLDADHLDAAQYPEIRIQLVAAEPEAEGRLTASGSVCCAAPPIPSGCLCASAAGLAARWCWRQAPHPPA
jgi:hypothetical protein